MAKEILRVLNDLDMVGVEIETALDALAVYESTMEDDLESIDTDKPYTVEIALHNCKANAAVLQLCQNSLNRSIQELHKLVEEGIAVGHTEQGLTTTQSGNQQPNGNEE